MHDASCEQGQTERVLPCCELSASPVPAGTQAPTPVFWLRVRVPNPLTLAKSVAVVTLVGGAGFVSPRVVYPQANFNFRSVAARWLAGSLCPGFAVRVPGRLWLRHRAGSSARRRRSTAPPPRALTRYRCRRPIEALAQEADSPARVQQEQQEAGGTRQYDKPQ